ncbi:MAG: Tm-1-like ATP-binding domain-containing protein [Anaerolineae bacterium]|nr:Tm-1-like ATP-binding domain-containing protein [Anaerolineae bacterium]
MAIVVLLGTLDTKGLEYDYVRRAVRSAGCDVLMIDAGVRGTPLTQPDIIRDQVAEAAGASVKALADAGDRNAAVDTMARGATVLCLELFRQGKLHGLLGLGGAGGSVLATTVMRALPVGVPKLMVSTLASGDTRPYVGEVDITMMYSVVDIAGINRISERILSNAAAAIAGMATGYANFQPAAETKPLIGATMFGVTTPCVTEARQQLESRGYEVIVFHATGTGGRSLETLIEGGYFAGVLDVTTTELADELVGGVLSAGDHRLEAAGKRGLPQVVSLGALDMVNFGPRDSVPAKFEGRQFHQHNATVTLMRTTPEENAQLGRIIATKLNAATGKTAVFIPLKGVSMIDVDGKSFYAPEADAALFENLKSNLRKDIEVIEMNTDINDPQFARAMAAKLDEFLRTTSPH